MLKAVLNEEETKTSLDGNVYDIYDRRDNFKVSVSGVYSEKEAIRSCQKWGIYGD